MNKQSIKILVVDDSRSTRKMIHALLKQAGFKNIIEAASPSEALSVLNSANFDSADSISAKVDLILSDWDMPEKSGYEFLCEIRQSSSYKDVPFVMLTSNSDIKCVKLAVTAGVNDYLVKPFSPAILEQKILSILGMEVPKD